MYETLHLLNFPFDFIHKRENTYEDGTVSVIQLKLNQQQTIQWNQKT